MVAQLGMDMSQFKLGMKEANALQVAAMTRAKQASAQIAHLQNRARVAAVDSARYAGMAAAIPLESYEKTGTNLVKKLSLVSSKIAREQVTLAREIDAANHAMTKAIHLGNDAQIAESLKVIEDIKETRNEKIAQWKQEEIDLEAHILRQKALIERSRIDRADYTTKSVVSAGVSAELSERAGVYKGSSDAMLAYQMARSERMAQTSSEHITRLYNTVFSKMMMVGAAVEAVIVGVTVKGAEFNHMLKEAANNTSLAAGDISKFKDAIKSMGVETGLPFDKLAAGFRDIENYGFTLKETIKIADEAKKVAVATGSDFAVMADLVAGTMKNYKIGVEDAAIAANVFYVVAKNSKGQMEDHVKTFGRLTMAGRNHGQSMVDLGAAYIVLSQHQETAGRATTGLVAMLNKMANPTKDAISKLNEFDKQAGNSNREFRRLFSDQGVSQGAYVFISKLNGLIEKLKLKQPGASTQGILERILPFSRGGTEISTIVRELDEFTKMQKKVREQVVNTKEVQDRYNEMLKDNQVQLDRAKNAAIVFAGTISEALTPQIKYVTGVITDLTKRWNDLGAETQHTYIKWMEGVAISLIVVGFLGKIAVGAYEVRKALIGLGIVETVAKWRIALAVFATEASVAFGSVGMAAIVLAGQVALITAGLAGAIYLFKKLHELGEKEKRPNPNPATGKPYTSQDYRGLYESQRPGGNNPYLDSAMGYSLQPGIAVRRHLLTTMPVDLAKSFEKTLTNINKELSDLYTKSYQVGDKTDLRIKALIKSRDKLREDAVKNKIVLPGALSGRLDDFLGLKPPKAITDAEKAWQDRMDAMGRGPKKQKEVHDKMLEQAKRFVQDMRQQYDSIVEDSSVKGKFDRLVRNNPKFSPALQAQAMKWIKGKESIEEFIKVNQEAADSMMQIGRQMIEDAKNFDDGIEKHEKAINHFHKLMNQARKGEEGSTVFSEWMNKLSTDTAIGNDVASTIAKITIAMQAQKTADYKQTVKDNIEAMKLWKDNVIEDWKDYAETVKDAAKIVNDAIKDQTDYYDKLNQVHQKFADRATERTRPDLMYANRFARDMSDTNYFKSLSPEAQAKELGKLKNLGLEDWFNEQLEKTKELTQGYYELGGGVRFTVETGKNMSKEWKDTFSQAAKNLEIFNEMRDLATGVGDVFMDMLNNVRENGFRNFFSHILQSFDNMLFQMAAKWAQSQIVNMIFNAIGGLSFSANGGGGSSFTGGTSDLPFVGGRSAKLGVSTVGASLGASGGGMVVNNHITIMAHDPASFKKSKSQIMSDIANATSRAAQRNGR